MKIQSSMKKHFSFWCAILLIWVMAVLGSLLVMGYRPQPSGRPVSDEELVRMTVSKALRVMEVAPPPIINQLSPSGQVKPESLIPYRDADHFLSENPKCCPVETERGSTDKIVEVSGKVFYRGEDGRIHSSEPILLLHRQYYPEKLYLLP